MKQLLFLLLLPLCCNAKVLSVNLGLAKTKAGPGLCPIGNVRVLFKMGLFEVGGGIEIAHLYYKEKGAVVDATTGNMIEWDIKHHMGAPSVAPHVIVNFPIKIKGGQLHVGAIAGGIYIKEKKENYKQDWTVFPPKLPEGHDASWNEGFGRVLGCQFGGSAPLTSKMSFNMELALRHLRYVEHNKANQLLYFPVTVGLSYKL